MSIDKWKLIIKNWMNCYFDDAVDVNIQSLVSIITHLRKLDSDVTPSTSENSVLQEFISEKCRDFCFENGTETDLYIAASIVLYFVCINDKDVNMKSAMCKMLKLEDQEIITKFNKKLLNLKSPAITYKEVETAIIEACGQDAVSAAEPQVIIAETPPALRSLHGDVRKLQAALDAERFDRNFLQDELTRTNCKLQKLLNDKEQYKAEIVSLKAKISSCCCQEVESRGQDSNAHQNMMKILRQLEETEQRFVDKQIHLDDAVHEINIYKSKIDELKVERDKWMAFSQQEALQVGTLEGELKTERCNIESLKELVAELRQHNQNNILDGSMLECDDPNASVHSFGRNISTCSEACSNVVEVQLMEERANIVQLKRQLEDLQDQLKILKQRSDEEKMSFENDLSSKDKYIHDLLLQIDEGVQEQNSLKESFNDEISKLNNDINELEQKMRDNTAASNRMFREKFDQIKQLQDDKLILLQSLSDKTTHFENKISEMDKLICDLQEGLIKEQNSKSKMKEDYEGVLMKFKEKVLNRNNELIELQKNLSKNSEMIEELNLELRKQKALTEEVKTKCEHEIESLKGVNKSLNITLIAKNGEINTLKDDVATSREAYSELSNNLEELQELKNKLLVKFQLLGEDKTKLEQSLEEKNVLLSSLNTELQKVTDNLINKTCELDNKIEDFNKESKHRKSVEETNVKLNNCIYEFEIFIQEKQTEIESLNYTILKKDSEISSLQIISSENENTIEQLRSTVKEHATFANVVEVQLMEERANIVQLKRQLEDLQDQLQILKQRSDEEKMSFENDLSSKDKYIHDLLLQIDEGVQEQNSLKESFNGEISKLNNDINELEQKMRDNTAASNSMFLEKNDQINQLQDDKLILSQSLSDKTTHFENKISEMDKLICDLQEGLIKEQNSKSKMKEDYEGVLMKFKEKVLNRNNELIELQKNLSKYSEMIEELNLELRKQKALTEEVKTKCEHEIESLKGVNETLNITLIAKNDEINTLKDDVATSREACRELSNNLEELQELKNKLLVKFQLLGEENTKLEQSIEEKKVLLSSLNTELQKVNDDLINKTCELNKKIEDFNKEIKHRKSLEETNVKLNNCIHEFEVFIQEKQTEIESLNYTISKKDSEISSLQIISSENENTFQQLRSTVKEHENDQEQYKIEIVALKAKISSCRCQEAESSGQDFITHQSMTKIATQLEETEQRLVDKQIHLDDAVHELNIYKAKIDELNVERDKWMGFSRRETLRAGTLDNELKTERCNNESLKELVAELRQHDQNNILVRSTLGCDPNASVHSFGRNISTCSEACSNVVEVQLMEERANIVQLKRQLEDLQDQLKILKQRSDEEKMSFENDLSSKDKYIHDLLLQIDEGVQEQNSLKESFNDEISKLNNDINELEQKMRDNTAASNSMFCENFDQIKQLQDDKLILLQSLSDKTTHFENKISEMDKLICDLQEGLIKEQNSKSKMKEDYEGVLMKFKEKVLNRNNELIELQKNLSKNSEMIEELNLELRKQKALTEEVKTKCEHEIESLKGVNESLNITLIAKNDEINTLKADVATNREAYSELSNNLEELQELKNKLLVKFQLLGGDKTKLEQSLEEKNVLLSSLNTELQKVTDDLINKTCELDKKIEDFNKEIKHRKSLEETNVKLNNCIHEFEVFIQEKQTEIESLNYTILKKDSEISSLQIILSENENTIEQLRSTVKQNGAGAKESATNTVMEVRAEYEDKLNRMKAKMKQLYQEQITIFREKQKEEIASVEKREREALKKLEESSRAYEDHIKGLTLELWHFGEKYLLKSEEADWLRKKQTFGSLMSLQHISSSGLVQLREEKPRPSDTHSLRSLPVKNKNKEGRGLHMSDEEGEVFDNRCLKELASTPRARARSPRPSNAGERFSELKWRNSLCPPHLKSSYPAETQFAPAVDEDDIKCLGRQRKEVGITAYKKPGPPTPSKQAGRLSATDSELRESLRSCAEVTFKKTATPSRIKALFRSSRNDNDGTGTPRRRLSIFKSKK